MASVKVAVRVRPLNKRERDMECKVCIKMQDKKTSISNPLQSADIKDFTYDYSYWSTDSRDRHFATQEQVFTDLGSEVIDSAFQGYNACIFAYGQTGAGKSYTMMGMQDAVGLIPRICEGMYERMSKDQVGHKIEFKTEVSYLEIYNERVRDLLRPPPKKGDFFNLKVREHPKEGPYVQDLTKHIVTKYADIEKLMDLGNDHRTTASTNMNDVSSRSHAIFTLNFTQAKFFTDAPSETVSKIHLVDLAGSERANSTGATGQRLKEGANINKSLVTLGSVISGLAEMSALADSKKKPFIPYRDSVLTWLLKDSLGGNAKTIMIAAISPADVNYAETLSTLRYANRAKNIINKPTINEDPNVKLIRELREEIDKLRSMLQSTNRDDQKSLNDVEETKVAQRIHQNEAKVEQLTRDWNNKWKETQKIMEERALAFRREGFGIKMESDLPHLICVDDDILSTGVTLYHLNDGRTHVGGDNAVVKQDIVLYGPGIEPAHCILESVESSVILHPIADECYVNGTKIKKPTRLSQGAVMLLGKTNMFRFNHPAEAAKLRQKFASVENLASLVPTKELEAPSYLFYNKGLEMERRYREETRILEEKRKDLEKKQAEDARKLVEARKEIEELQLQKRAAEESQKRELEETQQQLEVQRQKMKEIKVEQERARDNAHRELQDLKERILKEQDHERQKLDEEVKRLASLKEIHQQTLLDKEKALDKEKEELSKRWEVEKEQIEKQREEVLRLQTEFENYRDTTAKQPRSPSTDKQEQPIFTEEPQLETFQQETKRLREELEALEREYEDEINCAQKEIYEVKELLKKAEYETLQGKIDSDLNGHWKRLEEVQQAHKAKQDEIQSKIRKVKELLEKAEVQEEEDLVGQEKAILERKEKRTKVEEATKKLMEMQAKFKETDGKYQESQNLLDWQNREEIRELAEQRQVLMELLSMHQAALLKASQSQSEAKTKLESHLHNEKILIDPIREKIKGLEKELEPLLRLEAQIDRKCENIDKEVKEKKKLLYKQRKRINLLEKQLAQSSGSDVREGLNAEELEDLENDRQADLDLIHREKSVLHDMETKFRAAQESAELQIGEACQELEKRKQKVTDSLTGEKKRLNDLIVVHKETTECFEAELQARNDMLKKVKEKVVNDKRELARLELKKEESAAKAAEDLFLLAEVMEKELKESGKKEELSRIREHRKKLQELDRQLRLAERREKFSGKDGEDQQCIIL